MACYHPIAVKIPDRARGQIVPCGQCIGCKLEKSRQWAVRIMHEAQMHKDNNFLTLTYANENLSSPSLNKRDLQLFFKKLRKKGTLRYYACGEYGEYTGRPHYHTCIFGIRFPEKYQTGISKSGKPMFESPLATEAWGLGRVWIQDLTFESAAYVARYCTKILTGDRKAEYGDRKTEFALMSRRPGIGATWLEKYRSDVYPSDEVVARKDIICKPPRYYDNKNTEQHALEMYELREKRQQNRPAFLDTYELERMEKAKKLSLVKRL